MGLISHLVTFKKLKSAVILGQGLFLPGQKKFVRETSSNFSKFVAFLCREPWGCVWGVSHVEIRECDRMGAIAKGKLKFLLPPEHQWSVSLATIFHGVLIMKLPFP